MQCFGQLKQQLSRFVTEQNGFKFYPFVQVSSHIYLQPVTNCWDTLLKRGNHVLRTKQSRALPPRLGCQLQRCFLQVVLEQWHNTIAWRGWRRESVNFLFEASKTSGRPFPPGGTPHMKGVEMLVGNFELNPSKGDRSGRGPNFF